MKDKRAKIVMIVMCAVALLGFSAWLLHNTLKSAQTRAISEGGFEYYTPTYLPEGVEIKKRQLFIQKYKSGGDPYGRTITNTRVYLSFRDVNNVYAIRQRSISHYKDASTFIATNDTSYDPSSRSPSCKAVVSNATKYRLCHWYDYGDRYSVYEIRFILSSTAIDVELASPNNRVLSEQEIKRFVLSFTPGDPNELMIRESFGGA